jgi:tRNA G10  N-methylase Trm11
MLPPKAARMVVNIGLGADALGKTLLDPFCGMGTIPGEAVLRGSVAMGSDNAKEAIEKAKKNSIWLRNSDSTLPPITYFVSDATHVSENIRKGTIDAIVTEPFMGSPNLGLGKITDKKEIRNAVKGLEKLYIGCLREWHDLLKTNGVIVMALPEIELGKTKYFVKNVIDSCETLGYTTSDGPLPYSRPQATVRRMFYKFIKK